MILIIVLLFTGVRSEVLILKSESNVSSVNQPIDINDLGNVYLNKSKLLFFMTFAKAASFENVNISKYLNIKIQTYNLVIDNNTFNKNLEFNTRIC